MTCDRNATSLWLQLTRHFRYKYFFFDNIDDIDDICTEMYLTFFISMDMIRQRRALVSGEGEIMFLPRQGMSIY